MLIVYVGAGLWALSFLAVVGMGVRAFLSSPKNPPDPAIREDRQWEGIENEWHAFVDSFGVREVQR